MSTSFSVLTVSKRTGWEELAKQSIARQTLQPKEWIVITEDQMETFKLPAFVYPAPKSTTPSNLNKSLNLGLSLVRYNYVIFYQDFIDLPENCFEKLMQLATPKTFVTTCTPKYDGSDDGRYLGVDQPRPCLPEEWEANVALAPMKIMRDLGGFWEELDKGWSWDNVHAAKRAAMMGAKFIIDESNRPKLLPHEQSSKLKMELNADRCEDNIRAIREGRAPLRLNHL